MLIERQVEVIRADLLGGVPHGFLGRRGGVSEGVCAGLNTGHGSGDDPVLIVENRRRALAAVAPGARLVTVHQIPFG
jgi:copper oxidase (laccase) domain-containing protein